MVTQSEVNHIITDKGFSNLIRKQYDIFWMNNCLGYDVNGKVADPVAYAKLEICCKKPEDVDLD